eukprot:TRINITY_DN6308_c0_g3_i1.p1 TRINITY_DN6308_c0_g3~~TRINITY_DN6308_c0_g3_i1.p1  ORF type:complete len:283 (-),score=29.03 TRINITY_DN6308_c0_g3_i1:96-944(-)
MTVFCWLAVAIVLHAAAGEEAKPAEVCETSSPTATPPSMLALRVRGNFQCIGHLTTPEFTAHSVHKLDRLEGDRCEFDAIQSDQLTITNEVFTDQLVARDIIINIDGSIMVESITTDTVEAPSFYMLDNPQWLLTSLDDFETDESLNGWSQNTTSNCSEEDNFLGGHCAMGPSELSKRYDNLPPHSTLRLNAFAHFIDDWRGEAFFVEVDGQRVFEHIPTASTHEKAIDYCGRSVPDPQFNLPIDITISHNSSSVLLTFGSSLTRDSCEASFGIDNVMIYVK